ncbi:MAG TPA: SRPBCC domain-containing protein, partial [Allosphingosinicella sp.]|nr:SRPBCC domain-containing protein [Allosphingosinicella sp.]
MRLIAALVIGLAAAAPATAATKERAPDGTHLLIHEAVVDAPPEDVWAAISTAEGWKSWAVPVAWAAPEDVIETSYSAAARPGDRSTIRQQVLLRVPRRLMVFRTVKAPEGFPDFDTYRKVVSAFELEPAGDGRTRVRLTGAGYDDSEAGRRLLGFFEKGNQSSLDALKARFAKTAQPPLRSELEPLRFLLGHCWRGEFTNGSVDTHCFESAYGGQHVRDRHEVKGPGAPYRGETLYSWDGSAKRVGYTYWNSSGGVSRGTMVPKGEDLDFGDQIYTGPDGRKLTISTLWRKAGADSYETVSRSGADPTGSRV